MKTEKNTLYTAPNGKTWVSVFPGSNGRYVDDFDKVCQNFNNRFKCFNIDRGNYAFGDYEQFKECDSHTSYQWHMDENNVPVCGTPNNVNYEKQYRMPGKYEWNQCRLALCQAEREFAIGLAPFLRNVNFKGENRDKYGLNEAGLCKHVEKDPRQHKDECCGDMKTYDRSPYDMGYQCCKNDQLFDFSSGVCDDGLDNGEELAFTMPDEQDDPNTLGYTTWVLG